MHTDIDVVVIGAGLAGLGAATALRERNLRCVVLEASNRVGGRAWTTTPDVLGNAWFDMGAVWFHDAEHNPLVTIARSAGDRLLRSDEVRIKRTYVDSRAASEEESISFDQAWPRFENAADSLLQNNNDVPLTNVTALLRGDVWAPTIESWEGPVICAVDAKYFSARDWRRNALNGSNLVPVGGIGRFVETRLTPNIDIRLNTPVSRVVWNGSKGGVTLDTPKGGIKARACIVTASTGTLAAGMPSFEPPLPLATRESINKLPMGLALKIVLRATGPDRLGLPPHCSIDRLVDNSGGSLMPFQCWPFGRDYVQGWIGGSTAWALARAGRRATIDYALGHLRALFGGRADRVFKDGRSLVTRWDADPWIRGAYCYAVPGGAMARETLAEPIGDGHLLFAGEACNTPYAGTLAGAWLSGQDAARLVLPR